MSEVSVTVPEYDLIVINKFINTTQEFNDLLVAKLGESLPEYCITESGFAVKHEGTEIMTAKPMLLGTYIIVEHPDPEDQTVVLDNQDEFIWQWVRERPLPEFVGKLCEYVDDVYKPLCSNPVVSSHDNMLFAVLFGLCIECFDFQYVWTVPVDKNAFHVYGLTDTVWNKVC